MEAAGFILPKFHLVGFSLGAQLFSRVGRNYAAKRNNSLLIRMTGLDPAGNFLIIFFILKLFGAVML